MLPTKKQLDDTVEKRFEAEKDFKNRAFMVIETLCMPDIVCDDIEKLKGDIYMIAHSAIGNCDHPDWVEKTEKMFNDFRKHGL